MSQEYYTMKLSPSTASTVADNTYTMKFSPNTVPTISTNVGLSYSPCQTTNIYNYQTGTDVRWYEELSEILFSNTINFDLKLSKFYIEPITPLSIEILNPNKVVRFTGPNKQTVKTICSEDDIFDLEFACYLAYAKLYFNQILTSEGLEKCAKFLTYFKPFNKAVEKSIKLYKKELKEKEKLKKREKELKEIKARKRAKRLEKRRKNKC